jgi:prepilin-type processing-associated H-X9-DG protein
MQMQLPVDVAKLPQAQTISKHLFGSASCMVSDADGITVIGYSSGGNVSTAALVGGVAAGFALPAMTRARGQAQRSACASNLKQIGLGIAMYKEDHGGRLPANLAELVNGKYISAKQVFKCPRDAKPEEIAGLATSYHYVGALPPDAKPDAVVAYDASPGNHGGRNVLFADGHVEWMTEQKFQARRQQVK